MQHASPTVTRLPDHTKWTLPAMACLDKPTLHEYKSTIMVFKQDGGWWCASYGSRRCHGHTNYSQPALRPARTFSTEYSHASYNDV